MNKIAIHSILALILSSGQCANEPPAIFNPSVWAVVYEEAPVQYIPVPTPPSQNSKYVGGPSGGWAHWQGESHVRQRNRNPQPVMRAVTVPIRTLINEASYSDIAAAFGGSGWDQKEMDVFRERLTGGLFFEVWQGQMESCDRQVKAYWKQLGSLKAHRARHTEEVRSYVSRLQNYESMVKYRDSLAARTESSFELISKVSSKWNDTLNNDKIGPALNYVDEKIGEAAKLADAIPEISDGVRETLKAAKFGTKVATSTYAWTETGISAGLAIASIRGLYMANDLGELNTLTFDQGMALDAHRSYLEREKKILSNEYREAVKEYKSWQVRCEDHEKRFDEIMRSTINPTVENFLVPMVN